MSPKQTETVAIVGGEAPRNRNLARILHLATGFRLPVEVPRPKALVEHRNAVLVTCWADDAAEVAAICDRALPHVSLVVFTRRRRPEIFELASGVERISSIIAWPAGAELPRVWELAYSGARTRRRAPDGLSIRDPLNWSGVGGTWYPRTTRDLFATLEDIGAVLERAQIDRRVSRRVTGVAHEMLMNAMYDAPADNGKPRFAHDRTQAIALEVREAPEFILSTDGLVLCLQVTDPFGGLRREHVFGSLLRGSRGASGGHLDEVIDTTGGGAGLGLHRIVCDASSTVFDVVEARTTCVTAAFDLLQPNRERRKQPLSLMVFQRGVR